MKKKISFLFPGQGAQYPGMGKDFSQSFRIARETFEEADEILGEKFSEVIFSGSAETLTQTRNSQVAIFIVSVAILRTARQQLPNLKPEVCAGLSLGEYSALYATGKLKFADTLSLVQERARLMNEACERCPGTMAAVLGLDSDRIESAVKELEGVWVANYNAPGQTVISGTKEGVAEASQVLKNRGAKRVIPLAVHGAFHSGLMQSAQDGLAPWIQKASIQSLGDEKVDFVMNVPGDYIQTVDEIRNYLINQVTQSIRWEQSIEAMKRANIDCFIEIGCGKTLTGLNKKMAAAGFSIEKVSDLDEAANHLEMMAKV